MEIFHAYVRHSTTFFVYFIYGKLCAYIVRAIKNIPFSRQKEEFVVENFALLSGMTYLCKVFPEIADKMV